MPLRPDLQTLFDALMASHPEGLTLDELSDELVRKPVSHADIEALIGAFEAAGVDLTGPELPSTPADLARVLAAARALAEETARRPSAEEIAARTGLTPAAVRRALRLGRAVEP